MNIASSGKNEWRMTATFSYKKGDFRLVIYVVKMLFPAFHQTVIIWELFFLAYMQFRYTLISVMVVYVCNYWYIYECRVVYISVMWHLTK